MDAVKLLSEKKYPGDPGGQKKLTALITGSSGPAVRGASAASGGSGGKTKASSGRMLGEVRIKHGTMPV